MSGEQAKRKVYIIGAGGTKAINNNAPLNDELLPMILLDFGEYNTRKIADLIKRIYPSTKKIVDVACKTGSRLSKKERRDFIERLKLELPSIEDILSLLDDAILKNRPLCNDIESADVLQLRFDVVRCISGILTQKLDLEFPSQQCREQRPMFVEFMERLTANDTIITTNYDMVIDVMLYEVQKMPEYGFKPRHNLSYDSYHTDQLNNSGAPKILKLHGSMNWIYCPYCNGIDVCYSAKIVEEIFRSEPLCCTGNPFESVPKHRYKPMLIVPTMLKSYDNPVYESIWDQAEEALAYADEIVIAGYSMPVADIHLRTRLTRALIRNREQRQHSNHPAHRIKIVDRAFGRNKKEQDSKRWAEQHFHRLLGKEAQYMPIGFDGYVKTCLRQ